MSGDETTLEMAALNELLKALTKENQPMGEIGVLGAGDYREGDAPSNASIGAKHEFGDPENNLPIRSFLRVPLTEQMQKYLTKAGLFEEKMLTEVVRTKSVKPWLQRILYVGEQVIFDGFNTGGFGKWKPSNMQYKKNHQTLVETQQLRNSISSRVKE